MRLVLLELQVLQTMPLVEVSDGVVRTHEVEAAEQKVCLEALPISSQEAEAEEGQLAAKERQRHHLPQLHLCFAVQAGPPSSCS